jgi:MYXO-CTERM domain-containing protein
MDITTLALMTIVAGYGDPTPGDPDVEGPSNVTVTGNYPNYAERAVLLYTNAARVDPGAHEDAYNQGGCSFDDFKPNEQSAKRPLYWSQSLAEAARYHSQDMKENNYFEHESRDGTTAYDRIALWYGTTYVGENIAYGYSDAWDVQMRGWMCSSGHRSNIMVGSYTELGTGVFASHYTQDFGSQEVDTDMAIPMGIHDPQNAQSGDFVTFYGDYVSPSIGQQGTTLDDGPGEYIVVVNGMPYEMDLLWGSGASGVYAATFELSQDRDCHEYFFLATDSAGESRFPEDGSYLVGACDALEFPDMWVDFQSPISGRDDLSPTELADSVTFIGCSSSGSPRWGLWGFGLLALVGLRRKS